MRLERTAKRRDDFILGAFDADGAMICIAGREQIHLTATRSNAAAVRLYRREGFVVHGVERAAVRLARGGAVDKDHMALFL